MEDGDQAESADGQLIKKLVRYAMACDFSRAPIRRDGIKDKGGLVRGLSFLKYATKI